MKQYCNPDKKNMIEISNDLKSDDVNVICHALITIGLSDFPYDWSLAFLYDFLEVDNIDVVSSAITSLGHIARLHGKLDIEKIRVSFGQIAKKHPSLIGVMEDTVDDIKMFVEPASMKSKGSGSLISNQRGQVH